MLLPSLGSGPEPPRTEARPGGFTLPELVVLLVLLSLVLNAVAPRIGGLRDRLAVRGAREAAVGILSRARLQALLGGGSKVLVREAPPELVLKAPGLSPVALDLMEEYGVELEIPGPASRATLRFDQMGIGRIASRTLRFRRREMEAALAISSYGRVRRR